jgi:carbon storage regulator
MLVLSRGKNESIMIGDDIEITVIEIKGDKIRLGIQAPREIQVHRKEVYEAIRKENIASAKSGKAMDISILGNFFPGKISQKKTEDNNKTTGKPGKNTNT